MRSNLNLGRFTGDNLYTFLRQLGAEGHTFDFVYAESPIPLPLVANRDYFHPPLDFHFWRWYQKRDIPVGVYYCDVYWRFDLYRETIHLYKRAIDARYE